MSMPVKFLIAIIMDWLIGDPYFFPHPVKAMGFLINFQETIVRRFKEGDLNYKLAGLIIAIFNIVLSFTVAFLLLKATKSYRVINTSLEIFMIYQILAAGSLKHEAKKVVNALDEGLTLARQKLSMIVGRDTESMNEEEVLKATIETISENASDGVIAPMFYMFLLGLPGGMAYKMVNTMDSMLGYNNDKYRNLGYFPAKIDDLFNIIPSRLTGLLMIVSSVGKYKVKNAWQVFKRDRFKHKSPNSCQSESATAGLLGIELGGRRVYKGIAIEGETIGNKLKDIQRQDVYGALDIMVRSQVLFFVIYIIIRRLI